jgi:hypothetical protein
MRIVVAIMPTLRRFVLTVSLCAVASCTAYDAYQREEDYATAFRELKPLADQGDARAQTKLGIMYDHGKGVAQDDAEAVKWYRRAADQGDALAQTILGAILSETPNDRLCNLALTIGETAQLIWNTYYSAHVQEAKRRGLSIRKCAELAGRKTTVATRTAPRKNNTPADTTGRTPPVATITPPVSFKNVSSTRVCIMALTPPWKRLDWDRRFDRSIQEAKRRGLTLRQCRDLRQTEIASSTAPKVTQKSTPSPDLVMPIQKRLTALGYDTGSADGVMGRRTRNAIEAFQRDESLVVTGKATETLARLLETKLASRQKLTEPLTKTVTPTTPIAPHVVADLGAFHALVVGNDAYRSLSRLRTAVKDAKSVAALLKNRYGFRATTLINATRDEVIQALDNLRSKLTERDNLLIYYAGHGKLDRGSDRGFWLPVDAKEDSRTNWINNVTITDTLKATRAKHVLVVADSCYSGTLTRDTRGIDVRPKESDYIEKIHQKKSRTAMASGGLEPVSDSGGSGHSVFAKAFMDALRDNQGVIDGAELFHFVKKQVILNADQIPNYANIRYAGHEVGGDFLFARKLE